MRRITYWALSTLSVLVLLFSYRTSTSSSFATGVVAAGTANAGSSGAGTGDTGSSTDPGTSSGSSGTAGTSTDPGTSSGSSGTADSGAATDSPQTVIGDAISTRFGDVQVQITVADGKITKSVVTQVPWNDRRDQEINGYAVPILNEETVSAQSASIDMVSGATFTSDGYIQSLQSAIDRAHLP